MICGHCHKAISLYDSETHWCPEQMQRPVTDVLASFDGVDVIQFSGGIGIRIDGHVIAMHPRRWYELANGSTSHPPPAAQ